jgi:hypothetical protein
MTTLMIKDLSLAEELDRSAMAAVHGGRLLGVRPSYSYSDLDLDLFSHNVSTSETNITKINKQTQIANVGNNVASFGKGFSPYVSLTQTVR